MKKLFILLFSGFICCQVCAQKSILVRVYDMKLKKMNMGFVLSVTDSSLELKLSKSLSISLPVKSIGLIKTKRSAGHNVLLGATIGAVPLGLLGLASGDKKVDDGTLGGAFHDLFTFSPAQGLVGGLVAGGMIGAAVGGITALFKTTKSFAINGDPEKWKVFQLYISNRSY